MDSLHRHKRWGISLMEVLISIGVIGLGIFGVASLIPVAQFKVAEGTSRDRQAAFGPSAAAEFRIRQMGDPNTWESGNVSILSRDTEARANGDWLERQAYCLDPLGLAENGYAPAMRRFPINGDVTSRAFMTRVGLKNLRSTHADAAIRQTVDTALARDVFFLKNELEFDRPLDEALQPRRQYFVDERGVPTATFATASMSWFATLTPTALGSIDEFVLSIVVVRDRVPALATLHENWAPVECQFAGEIVLPISPRTDELQMTVADLKQGDWLLLNKFMKPDHPDSRERMKRVFRWTQIIGASEPGPNQKRRFSVANDDFIRPGEVRGSAIFMKGVKSVYERTIRLNKLHGRDQKWHELER